VAAEQLAIRDDVRPCLCRVAASADGNLSPQLARLLLDTHTTIGDFALDVDNDAAFAAAAAQAGRRLHALGGAQHLAAMSHAAGYIDMILLHWPRPAVNPQWLLVACRSLLRNAGCLVIAARVGSEHRISRLSALRGAATTADLHLIDHIAAVNPAGGTATRAATPPAAAQHRQHITGHDAAVATPLVPHTDLLIFATQAGPR
jgi:hypothetical protein